LKSFYEPDNKDEEPVVLEYQNLETTNLETSPIELQPSMDKKLDKTLSIHSNNSSEKSDFIENTSMIYLFSEDNEPIVEEPSRPVSQISVHPQKTHHSSTIEINKFKTFNQTQPQLHKNTVIEPKMNRKGQKSSTRNNFENGLNSKFTSHTIQ